MFRKIALIAAVMGVTLGLYLYVSRSDRGASGEGDPPGDTPLADIASTQKMEVISGGDVRLGAGEGGYFRVLDKESGRVKYEFRSKTWNPVGNNTVQMDVPDIRLHSPEGEITYLTAERAELEIVTGSGRSVSGSRQNVEPRRGWLRGRVKITVDRSNRAWREAHADRLEREQHPENLVFITMDEARFDMDTARLTSDGPITLTSDEAEVKINAGTEALSLTWSQIGNPIDFLAFRYGGTMALRKDVGIADLSMTAAREKPPDEGVPIAMSPASAPAPVEVAKQNRAEEEAEATLRAVDPRLADVLKNARQDPLLGAGFEDAARRGGKKRGGTVYSYRALFKEQVRVEQFDGDVLSGQLDCEELELTFDLGSEQRKAERTRGVGRAASSPANGMNASERPAQNGRDATADAAAQQPTRRTTLHWTGPMTLRPADVQPASQPSGRRFDALATGEHVRVKFAGGGPTGAGVATCKRLVFTREPEQVLLIGTDTSPAHLTGDNGREMSAPEIMVDRTTGKARLSGPGLLRDPNASSSGGLAIGGRSPEGAGSLFGSGARDALEITWNDHVDIELGKVQRPAPSESQPSKTKDVDVLRKAGFFGKAALVQGSRRLDGDEIKMVFGEPRKAGALADHITRLECRRGVLIKDGDQVITAESLDADLMLTPEGRNLPTHAVASGNVTADDRDRHFEAERMTLDFDARSAPTGEASNTRVAIRHVVADGRVRAFDPGGQLDVIAEHLDAELDDAGQLRRTLALGAGESGWAYLRQGDYGADGHHVTIDVAQQLVEIPGRGHAAFTTRRDFDGRDLSEAVAVSITFDQGMTLKGGENIGEFNGHVHASTDSHDLKCDQRLTVRFADDAANPTPSAGPVVNAASPVAMSTPRVAAASGSVLVPSQSNAAFTSASLTTAGPPGIAAASTVPAKQPSLVGSALAGVSHWFGYRSNDKPRSTAASSALRIRKRPTFVLAEGNAVALTTDAEPQGRVLTRLLTVGPAIQADLVNSVVTIRGRGSMLIEDYRPPRSTMRPAGRTAGPLGGGNSGPSQTAFAWANSMEFKVREDLVTFDRFVQMIHRSGNQLVLQGTTDNAMAADPEKLRTGQGRLATLTCERLVAQFMSQARSGRGAARSASVLDARWTDLKHVDATGLVHLTEGTRKLTGESISFRSETNELVLRGGANSEASMTDEDETTQHVSTWRGRVITWNRATGAVATTEPRISAR